MSETSLPARVTEVQCTSPEEAMGYLKGYRLGYSRGYADAEADHGRTPGMGDDA